LCDDTVLLDAEEFSMLERDVLLVSNSGVQFREFRLMDNGSAVLCKEPAVQLDVASLAEDRFGAALGYVTLVGLGISVICLALHLLAFCLSRSHRASANNLASLCVALLVAYMAFLLGQVVRQHHAFCVASAVLTLYCFLAAFAWMLAIAFDVWRSLRRATTQLRYSSASR
jgi:NhaP-type Na+/H+ or K+/H+ antiporter